jgi:hypothetical protein
MMFQCKRCSYRWFGRISRPAKSCPGCKTILWNTPRTQKSKRPVAKYRGDIPQVIEPLSIPVLSDDKPIPCAHELDTSEWIGV